MKRMLILTVLITAVLACGTSKEILHVYNWADYLNPLVIEKFEEKQNCKVVINFFDSNEALYAKLKAGASGYDVMFPSSYMSKLLFEQKMIVELDHSKIPNIRNIDRAFMRRSQDPVMKYSVPYMLTFTGIAYNKSRVSNFVPSWSMYDRSDLKGRMTLLNDMREVIGAALKLNGFGYNTPVEAEIARAGETAIEWKRNIAKFDVDEAKRGLASGEFFLIQAYNGDALQLMEENADIAFALPEEGTAISLDDFVIPAAAKNPDLAYRFIDFMLDAENSAENMNSVCYLSPNTAAQKLMDDRFLKNPVVNPPQEILGKCDFLMDMGVHNAKYSAVWDRIKSAE